MSSQDKFDEMFPSALDLALDQYLDADDPRKGYDYEQNVKTVKDALTKTFDSNVETFNQWAAKAVRSLKGP